jgi:hypothetical protein
MNNNQVKAFLLMLIFGCIILGALTCISAVGDSNITDVGTSSFSDNATLNNLNTNTISTPTNTNTILNNHNQTINENTEQLNDSDNGNNIVEDTNSTSNGGNVATTHQSPEKSSMNNLTGNHSDNNIKSDNGSTHIDSAKNSTVDSNNSNQVSHVKEPVKYSKSNVKKESHIVSENFKEVFGKAGNFTIKLLDKYGNPIIGQHVALQLTRLSTGASKIYWVTTDVLGFANLEIHLAPGDYSVKSSYHGNDNFSASQNKTNSLKVLHSGSTNTTNNTPTKNGYISMKDIASKSKLVADFIKINGRLPNYVNIGNHHYSLSEFGYFMTGALNNIKHGSNSDIKIISVSNQSNISGGNINGKLSANGVLGMASRINAYILAHGFTPKYDATNGLGKINFENYIYVFSQALSNYNSDHKLPSNVNVNTSVFKSNSNNGNNNNNNNNSNGNGNSHLPGITGTNSGINDKNTIKDTSSYLGSTAHCEVNNPKIQALAHKLTSGLTSTLAKANAIFKFVRDQISYKYYANTRYGAAGTLAKGYGNCVDQASLSVALYRAAGISARYVHGKNCHFSSGLVSGHVWSQVLIDGVWYASDTTSHRNSLGLIKNWNTHSFKVNSITKGIGF